APAGDGGPRAVRRADGDAERDGGIDVEAARVAGFRGEAERGPGALEERRGAVADGGNGEGEARPARRRRETGMVGRVEAGIEREGDEHHVPGERPRHAEADEERALGVGAAAVGCAERAGGVAV